MVYRFVGTAAEVGPLKFDRVGQRVEMEDRVARLAQVGGCQLLTEAEFNSFKFTAEDLKIWSDPFIDPFEVPTDIGQAKAKAEFISKIGRARERFAEIRREFVAERQAKEGQRLAQEVSGETPKDQSDKDKE